MIREVNEDEYEQLMSLYCQLHETSVPEYKGDTRELWQRCYLTSRIRIFDTQNTKSE